MTNYVVLYASDMFRRIIAIILLLFVVLCYMVQTNRLPQPPECAKNTIKHRRNESRCGTILSEYTIQYVQ